MRSRPQSAARNRIATTAHPRHPHRWVASYSAITNGRCTNQNRRRYSTVMRRRAGASAAPRDHRRVGPHGAATPGPRAEDAAERDSRLREGRARPRRPPGPRLGARRSQESPDDEWRVVLPNDVVLHGGTRRGDRTPTAPLGPGGRGRRRGSGHRPARPPLRRPQSRHRPRAAPAGRGSSAASTKWTPCCARAAVGRSS